MYCKNCGKQLPDNVRFCGSCGTKVEQEPAPVEPAAAVPTPVEPAAVVPTPVEPAAVVPTPVEPAAPAQTATAVITPERTAEPVPAPIQEAQSAPAPAIAEEIIPAPTGAVVKEKKKSIVPIIIAAAAAVLVIAGVLIFSFGRSAITRTFMGEERYAVSLVTRYAEETAKSEPVLSMVTGAGENSAAPALKSVMTISNNSSASAQSSELASALLKEISEKGLSVDLSANVDLENKFKKSMFGNDQELLEALLEVINSAEISASAKADGENTELSLNLAADGQSLNLEVYEAEDGSTYLTCADLFEQPILVASSNNAQVDEPDDESDEESEETDDSDEEFEIDQEKLAKLYEKIIKAWEKAYEKAEFTYEKAEFSVGSDENAKTFKGQKVTATLEQEEYCELIMEVLDIINEDDYVDDIITELYSEYADAIHSSLDDAISSLEDSMDEDSLSLKFTVDTYVTSANKPCGVEITISYKENGEKQSVVFSSLTAGSNTAITLTANKVKLVDILSEKIDSNSGVLTAQINTSSSEKKFVGVEVAYTDAKVEEAFDTKILTGKFEISPVLKGVKDSLEKQYIDYGEEGSVDYYTVFSKSKLTIESAVNGGELELALGTDINKIGSASVKLALKNVSGDVAAAPSESSVLVYDEVSGAEKVDMQLYMYNAIKQKLGAAEKLAKIAAYYGYGIDSLDERITSLESNKVFYEHYSAFDGNNSYNDAANDAYALYDDFIYGDNALSRSTLDGRTFTLKLWFDKDGKLNVIDPDGFSYNWESVFTGTYKNRYVEFTVTNGSFDGVCVVLTDSADDIPSKLPNYFNYYDRVFEYDSEAGYYVGVKDSFVVGACPSLSKGVSSTEEKAKTAVSQVDEYNAYAQSVYTAFNKFLTLHNASVNDDSYGYFSFTIDEGGNWSASTSFRYDFTVDLEDYKDQLCSLLASSTSGLKSAYARVYVKLGEVVGVAVSHEGINIYLSNFMVSAYGDWCSLADGVESYWGDYYVVGTYPILPSADSAATIDNALDYLAGKWKLEYYSDGNVDEKIVTLSKDDLGARVDSNSYIRENSYSFSIYDSDGDYILYYDISWSGYEYIYLYTDDGEYYKYTRDF